MKALMKIAAAVALLSLSPAHAESLKDIFQSIADAAPTGNGDGHEVREMNGKYSQKKELAKLKGEIHVGTSGYPSDCMYDVHAGIDDGLKEIKKTWSDAGTASRLQGLNKVGAIKDILYTEWDPATGDSEYCSLAIIKVIGEDGSVLVLNYNETD